MILTLKINRDELSAVNIFDGNKNVVKTVSKEQYDKDGGIAIKNLENQLYTFEIVTEFYNLQFNKTIGNGKSEEQPDIFTQNRQIMVKAKNDIKNISIYSISGALILQQDVNTTQFESKNLESGVYLVQVIQNNGKTLSKKVKL